MIAIKYEALTNKSVKYFNFKTFTCWNLLWGILCETEISRISFNNK